MRESISFQVPLSHVWVSIAFSLFPLILPLPDLQRCLSVCACIRPDMFSLSLSLSLSPIDVSVYLSIFSACLRSNAFAKKQRQVQS
jgi:hypothetical protein